MPAADRPAQIGRHAGGRGQWSGKRVRRAVASGLFMASTLFVAHAISWVLFHRDFSSSGLSLQAFGSDLVSFVIAVVGVGLTAVCAAGLWRRLRHRSSEG